MIVFGLGSAVSPMVFAVSILFLTSKKGQVVALAIGDAIVLAVVGALVLKSGATQLSSPGSGPSTLSGGIDTFLGVLLLALGVKTFLSRNKPKKKTHKSTGKGSRGRLYVRNIGLGAVLAGTNKSMILYFEAAKKAADNDQSAFLKTYLLWSRNGYYRFV